MGDLFWNKVFGALFAIGLIVLGLHTLSHTFVHADPGDTLAYPFDASAVAIVSADEEEETGPVDFGLLLANASLSDGASVARRCASCHSFDQGGANMTGPALWGSLGRPVAAIDGYAYSSAMVEYAQGGSVAWDYQNMYDYLESPRTYISGTAMGFAGLRNQEDRINLLAYMREQSDSPLPVPAPLPAPEAAEEAAGIE